MNAAPRPAMILGLAGLVPFVALALGGHLASTVFKGFALQMLAGYGATILAFMGGCRWGLAAAGMGEGPTLKLLGLSVIPSLWAWLFLFAPPPWDLLGIAAGLALLLAADLALTKAGGAPAWWPALRWPLTVGAVGSLIVGAAA